MKKHHISKKIAITLAIILGTVFAPANQTYAAPGSNTKSCRYLLGMVSWDCNTNLIDNASNLNEDDLKKDVWTVVANIITDATVISAYLIIGFVIYGGYLYMFSRGESAKIASGKKTLTRAFIGLGIVLCANVILNSIRIILGAQFSADCLSSKGCQPGMSPETMVQNTLAWVIGVSGLVAAIFVVFGGVAYTTSNGDPIRLKKAKDIILYALIGLIICTLAEFITAFVGNAIRQSKSTAINTSPTTILTIQKENNELANHQ